jgi:hypothetical protein
MQQLKQPDMKKLKKLKGFYFTLSYFFMAFTGVAQAPVPFTAGNIVVCRVGTGVNGTLSSIAWQRVFLDEYTPAGSLVQTIAMPFVGGAGDTTNKFTSGGDEYLNLSTNGQYLLFTGYNLPPGVTSAGSNSRVIGRVKYDGTINTTTAPATSGTPRSAASDDGINLWYTGTSAGVRYTTLGSTSFTQVTSTNSTYTANITNGQLYASRQNDFPRIVTAGTGLPITTGQVFTGLPGNPLTGANSYQFVFVDIEPSVAGPDVLYVTSDTAVGGGVQKWSLVGGSWVSNGTVGSGGPGGLPGADAYRALTAKVSGTGVTLFVTRQGSNTSSLGGQVVSIVDNSGYNGVFSATPTVIADIATRFGANDVAAFKGVALVPQPPPLKVSAKIFLQGAYLGSGFHKDVSGTWASILNANALTQPFNVVPFNYAGTESVASNFITSTAATTDILDWVLVELRDATTPSTVIATRAAFVREDGKVVDLDGNSDVSFPGVANGSYYIVIKHRNHLGVRSATAVALSSSGSATTYDFSSAQSQAFQDGTITPTNDAMKDLGGGVFGLWAGNANGNTNVRFTGLNNDAGIILSALGGNQAILLSSTYNSGDLNLDGTVRYTGLNNDAGVLLGVLGSNQAAIYGQHQ